MNRTDRVHQLSAHAPQLLVLLHRVCSGLAGRVARLAIRRDRLNVGEERKHGCEGDDGGRRLW